MPTAADIFISYAHIDNESLIDGHSGWVSYFHRVLEKRLSMLLGERRSIWRDRELKGNERFDDTISGSVENARLFVPVITPRYVRSDYCRKEFSEFLAAAEKTGGLQLGDKSRVFKVLKTPVELDEHPEEIRGQLGYEFYQIEEERRKLREFSPDAPTAYREKFMLVLDDLAQEISDFLRHLDALRGDAAGGVAGAAKTLGARSTGKTVYLAQTTSDVKEVHDAVRRELLEAGHRVVPDALLPLENEAFVAAIDGYLAEADLAVHLIGQRYGFVPEDALHSSLRLQLERTREKDGLGRVIWMPPDLESSDERQQRLIEFLRGDPAAHRNSSLLETTLEELKAILHKHLAEPDAHFRPMRTFSSSVAVSTLMTCCASCAATASWR